MMGEFVVEIYGEIRHETRLEWPDSESLEDEIWRRLDDETPNDIAGPAIEAFVQNVHVRELYDWERNEDR